MSIYTHPVRMLLCGLLLSTLAIAVLNTLVPLWLAHKDMPTWQVGMIGSAYFTGNLAGTLLTGWVIRHQGFNRSYYLASLLFAIGCAGLGSAINFWCWFSWRFIAGIGCAMIWVVVESALVSSGSAQNRGRLLAAYMVVYYLGTVLGQLMVSRLPTQLMSVLPWATALTLLAILPLLFAQIGNHDDKPHQPVHIWPMLKLRSARHGITGCIVSGIVLGSLYGLMPLWLNHQGVSDARIGIWIALLVCAGIIGQWPVGYLADRYGRLRVLRGQVAIVILGCLVMLGHMAMAPGLLMLGAASFTLYPVAMAWACEKVEHYQLVAMNQALLISYTIGSLFGPTFTAMLMQHFSDQLFFIVIACVALVYLLTLYHKEDCPPSSAI
ncbi:MFS transporter [Enterobacteriaceae bacterium ESL0689]|nr:MFS transporter [Enterobacteriaceae bacterium ESL0689]